MIIHRTCVACAISRPWRELVRWTSDLQLEKRWTTALTLNNDKKRILELKLEGMRREGEVIYLCESHFDRDNAFNLTNSGYMIRPDAVPVNVRPPSPSPIPNPTLTKRSTTTKRKQEEARTSKNETVPPSKMMPSRSDPIEITETSEQISPALPINGKTEVEVNMDPAREGEEKISEVKGEKMMNAGGKGGATVKIKEIDTEEHQKWVNSVTTQMIPLNVAIERELRKKDETAAAAAQLLVTTSFDSPVDPVDDCINSVIRQATLPQPSPTQSNLLKPNLTYETLCYEAFEFIKANFQQTALTMETICHYISNKYRYFACGIMWRKQIFRILNTSSWIAVERLDKPENKEDDSLYSLNRDEYDYRYREDGEVRVRWMKRNKKQANNGISLFDDIGLTQTS